MLSLRHLSVMAAKRSAAVFVGASGERFRKIRQSKGARGTRFPLVELRGGSLLSGCWGEASGAGRGQGPAQLSDGNRRLLLGITCRHTFLFSWF